MADEYKKTIIKKRICWIIAFFFAIFWLLVTFIPFLFMVLNSLKEQFEMLTSGVFTLPKNPSIQNYIAVLNGGFWGYFGRSVIVVAISLALLLFIASCASYPLSRMQFKGRSVCYALIIACMSIPMHVTLIPVFKMATKTGLYDTIWALPGPYVAFALAISVFILTGFMEASIPKEIEEAAEIDGCGKYRTFFSIILPLSVPGLSTLGIYNGVNFWNEFSFVKTLTQSVSAQTLPMAMNNFKGEHSLDIPLMLSVLTLAVLPMIVLVIILQDKLGKGMTAGAVKG